jgi:hypothetical protein
VDHARYFVSVNNLKSRTFECRAIFESWFCGGLFIWKEIDEYSGIDGVDRITNRMQFGREMGG